MTIFMIICIYKVGGVIMFKNDKKRTLIMLLVVGVLVVLVGASYAFITFVIDGQKQVIVNAGVLDLYLDEKNEITISNALPMFDEVGMIQEEAFEFSLVNNTTNATNYVLRLKKIESTNELDEYDVKYGLIKEETSYIDHLSYLNDGIIDSGTIAGNDVIDYELRLWIDSEVISNDVIAGKSLSYKLELTASQVETTQSESCFNYTVNDYVVKDYNACAEFLIDKSVETDYADAISQCQYINEDEYSFEENYPTVWQEMVTSGIVTKEYGATITGYTCSDQFVRIPDVVSATVDENGLVQMANSEIEVPVVAIGEYAFYYGAMPKSNKNQSYSVQPLASIRTSSISKVVLPNSVLSISGNAFANLSLTNVELSSNLQVIGYRSFCGNLLNNIELPNSLILIDDLAFQVNNLVTVTIPSNVLHIGANALEFNDNLTKIINKTGRAFDWYDILGSSSSHPGFVTGTVTENDIDVTITSE